MSGDDLEELRLALAASTAEVALALLGEPLRETRRKDTWRWGQKGSLSVEVRGKKRGLWFSHEEGKGGDLFDLIQRERGGSFADAVTWARGFLGLAAYPTEDDTAARHRAEREREREAKRAADAAAEAAEKAKRIDYARRVAAGAVPIAGTLGERYLVETRAIPIPPMGWPSALRFHEGRNALCVVATDDAGNVQGVQLVHLTNDAQKRPAAEYRPTKQSIGDLSGAVVRLPGDPSTLLLAEGPETGVTVWAATGRETWIALGSMAKVSLPMRDVLVCADDDKRDAPAAKALRRTLAAWRGEGRKVKEARAWSRRRFDKGDFNDLAQREGIAAVATRIEAVLSPMPVSRERVSRDEGREKVGTAVGVFFDGVRVFDYDDPDAAPIAHGVAVDVGVGKSTTARREIARFLAEVRERGSKRNVAIAVPTHKLGDQQARDFEALPEAQAAGLRAAVWRGREADDPDAPGEQMCRDLDAVRDAREAGADNVEKAACRNRETQQECPFFRVCGYQKQKERVADLWIVPHELIHGQKPGTLGKLAALNVDEASWQDGLEGVNGPEELSLEAFAAEVRVGFDSKGTVAARLRLVNDLVGRTLAAQPDGPVNRAAMVAAGITPKIVGDGHLLTWGRLSQTGISPGMSRDARRKAVQLTAAYNRTVRRTAKAYKALQALMADDGPQESGWLELATNQTDAGPVRVLRIKGRREIGKGWHVPTLVMDALLDPQLVRPYWPTLKVMAEIKATTPHMRLRQLVGQDISKSGLVPDDYCNPEKVQERGGTDAEVKKAEEETRRRLRNSERLRAIVLREVRNAAPGRALVIVPQAVEEHWRSLGPLPNNMDLTHHNAVAGLDHWGDVRLLIVVSRPLPRPGAVERMAEALTGATLTAYAPNGYAREETPIEATEGTSRLGEAYRHPDPIAEAIRWQICEGELIQDIGRGRGVNRTEDNPLDVLLLTDVPLPLPVAETVTMADLAPSPADMMLSMGGVALENAADAAAAYPSLWQTPAAARQAFHRARCVTNPLENILYGECHAPLRLVAYQRAGAGRASSAALVALDMVPDPRAWLEERLGPLATFEGAEVQPKHHAADAPSLPAPAQPIVVAAEPVAPPPAPPQPERVSVVVRLTPPPAAVAMCGTVAADGMTMPDREADPLPEDDPLDAIAVAPRAVRVRLGIEPDHFRRETARLAKEAARAGQALGQDAIAMGAMIRLRGQAAVAAAMRAEAEAIRRTRDG